MVAFEHLDGTASFWSVTHRVRLWNRIEFLRGRDWAEVRIWPIADSANPSTPTTPEVIPTRAPMMVHLVGMIMDLLVECGGADVEVEPRPAACPFGCDNGYILLDGGNYERCPHCNPEED